MKIRSIQYDNESATFSPIYGTQFIATTFFNKTKTKQLRKIMLFINSNDLSLNMGM